MDKVMVVRSGKKFFISIRFKNGNKFMNSEMYTNKSYVRNKAIKLALKLNALFIDLL